MEYPPSTGIMAPMTKSEALRTGMITVHGQGQFYFDFITEQIRPDIITILKMIDTHQETH